MKNAMKFIVAVLIAAAAFAEGAVRQANSWKSLTQAYNRASDGDVIELTASFYMTGSLSIRKSLTMRSAANTTHTISSRSTSYSIVVYPGSTLTLTNITFDGKSVAQKVDFFTLSGIDLSEDPATREISTLILKAGTTIKNVSLTTVASADHAPVHVKEGAVLRIEPGAAILNCQNNSYHGKGGAICCDWGTVIMTGGTIAGCTAKGPGGAIHTDGTRVASNDHYGSNARGDIYLSGGYITNNVCGEGFHGGGIYLGNTGPMVYITGSVVVSNNTSGVGGSAVSDDISTYLLDEEHANRLKLVGHMEQPSGFSYEGIHFTGSVGVRYPDRLTMTNPQNTRFGGIWEYFNETRDESRQFFWNGDAAYRGWISDNSLVWSKYRVYEVPYDEMKVVDILKNATESPVYIELSEDYAMTVDSSNKAVVKSGMQVVLDLKGYDFICDFHVEPGGQVVIRDSSQLRTGKVWGHRESMATPGSPEWNSAFILEGGSYHADPHEEWIATNRVLIGNYSASHPYMVAQLAWQADSTQRVADVTGVALDNADGEFRVVASAAEIDRISYSTGDWRHFVHTNENLHVRIQAVAVVSNRVDGTLGEVGAPITIFDTARGGLVFGNAEDPDEQQIFYGREDDFEWNAKSSGIIKLLHITYRNSGAFEITNAVEQSYFQFPDIEFMATQRMTGKGLGIRLSDVLLANLGFNRVSGFTAEEVNTTLDETQENGLRRWENMVSGTERDHMLLGTAPGSEADGKLAIALTEPEKVHLPDTGYSVFYELRKSVVGGWNRVGGVQSRPLFNITLVDEEGKSQQATGFYRVVTLIVPDDTPAVTNELPSANIIGVLEVASGLANTLTAVPWTELPTDHRTVNSEPVKVSKYVHTGHLEDAASVQVADKGRVYHGWKWNKGEKKWHGAMTVSAYGLQSAGSPDGYKLERSDAVWVTRPSAATGSFFLVGQYSAEPATVAVAAGTPDDPVCTLISNPSLGPVSINSYPWNGQPTKDDLIRIPNEKSAPELLHWNATVGKWGRLVPGDGDRGGSTWRYDAVVPAGCGFWYHRCGESFDLELPLSKPSGDTVEEGR